jgi:transposase
VQALQFAYGDTALKKSAVYEWYHRFKNSQETLEDKPHSGHPSMPQNENVAKVKTLLQMTGK